MPDLSRRATTQEIMDDLMAGGPDLHRALRELDVINYVLGGNYVTLNALCKLLAKEDRKLHIADVGCGSGEMLRRMRSLLVRKKIDAVLTGIDANPHVVSLAKANTPPSCRIHYEALDIFSQDFGRKKFDIVTGTLFFHHFTNEQLAEFLSKLKYQVRLGFVINDIHRHWFAYYAIKWLTSVFSRSRMVKNDAPLSVMRAFRKDELEEILRKAGIAGYKIKWCWAFRWQVIVPGGISSEKS